MTASKQERISAALLQAYYDANNATQALARHNYSDTPYENEIEEIISDLFKISEKIDKMNQNILNVPTEN